MFRDPNSDSVKVTTQTINGPAENDLEVFIYHPENPQRAPQPGILHMHGGGYVSGTAEMNEGFCKKMANDIGPWLFPSITVWRPRRPFLARLKIADVFCYGHSGHRIQMKKRA